MKKKLIVEIEFIEEEEKRTNPLVCQNLVVFPDKDGNYGFYYSGNQQELNKLSLKKARVIEVLVIDDNVQILLEGKLSEGQKKLLKQRN